MSPFGRIYSFRARVALVLILTLVVSTAVLYELSRRAEAEIVEEVYRQRSELAQAIDIAQKSLTSDDYVREFLARERSKDNGGHRHKGEYASHVQRILVVDEEGRIEDSSVEQDIGKRFDQLGYGTFNDAINPEQPGENKSPYKIYRFSIQARSESSLDKASQIYILIVFVDNLQEELRELSLGRLLASAGVLLVAIFISLFLILEFTRPVGTLVEAARRVAAGDFDVNLQVKRRDELGNLIGVFNDMVRGLRERRELEARLYRAEQSAIVGRLASGIAHEVKNPLNYISLTIDYLRSKFAPVADDARGRFFEKMDGIKDEIKRLDRLIRNFLSYGRPLNLNIKPLAVRDLIKSILNFTAEQADQQAIEIDIDEQTDVPVIEADAERLKSCFSNLVINAQQAMPEGGKLTIGFNNEYEGVEITIADTGMGIAPEHIEKIFEPYFSTKETGTGLGLALVKRIIEGHGGRISVESDYGHGTTFRVWLPCHPPAGVLSRDNSEITEKEFSL